MIQSTTTRRDRRFLLRPARAWVDFNDPGASSAELVALSIAGLGFLCDDAIGPLDQGTVIKAVVLRLGDCLLPGDIVVGNVAAESDGRLRVGGFFHPATLEVADRLMAVIAGMEVVAAEAEE